MAPRIHRARTASALLGVITFATPALATVPDYDFHWATITHPGNAPYPGGGEFGQNAGVGGVAYEYRISRLEVTTSQWMEFLNAFAAHPEAISGLREPGIWGARRGSGAGGAYELNPFIPNAGMVPISFGMTWREAARYCNWLHNDKVPELWAMESGAYDVSTFGMGPGSIITDQVEHSPGAKFWIPTADEWLKAAHYDPHRYGEGQEGWWEYSHTSDTAPVSGMPGTPGAQTSAGLSLSLTPNHIPLMAYPDVQSPWGLWDTSGGNWEWTEQLFYPEAPRERGLDGSFAGQTTDFAELMDVAWNVMSLPPNSRQGTLRIASDVPTPGTVGIAVTLSFTLLARRIPCPSASPQQWPSSRQSRRSGPLWPRTRSRSH